MRDWDKFEQFIKWNANQISRNESDFDDFVQIGTIAAWEARRDKPDATDAYVRSRINYRMRDYSRHLYDSIKNSHYQNELPENIYDYI